MLISLPLHVPLSDPTTHSLFRAGLSSRGNEVENRVHRVRRAASEGIQEQAEVTLIQSAAKARKPAFASDIAIAIKELQSKYMYVPVGDSNQTMFFAKRGDTVVGVFVGGSVQKQSVAATIMQDLADRIDNAADGPAQTTLYQLCGSERNADFTIGIVADAHEDPDVVFTVQEHVSTWAEGRCVSIEGQSSSEMMTITYINTDGLHELNATTSGNSTANRTISSRLLRSRTAQLDPRADCRAIQAVDGDGCGKLASKCGVTAADFTKYNPDTKLCSTLVPGQWMLLKCLRESRILNSPLRLQAVRSPLLLVDEERFVIFTDWEPNADIQFSQKVLDSFVKQFAPDPPGNLALKIILDIISFALTAATGPFFNNCRHRDPTPDRRTFMVAQLKHPSPEKHSMVGKEQIQTLGDNLKDTSRAVIAISFTTAKDAMKPEPASGQSMSKQLMVIVRQFKQSLTDTSTGSFSCSNEGIDALTTLTREGKLLDAKPTGKLDMEDRMTKMFYAMLIPVLWRQKSWKPVLMDTGVNCDAKFDRDAFKVLPDKNDGYVCYEGKRYHLVRPDGKSSECPTESAQHWGMTCHWNKVKAMDGFDKLTGGSYANLKMEDIVASIVSRKKVGWKNPSEEGSYPNPTNEDDYNKMWDWIDGDNMIQSPGVVDIPVCSGDEIRDNWSNKKNDYYSWPCNKP